MAMAESIGADQPRRFRLGSHRQHRFLITIPKMARNLSIWLLPSTKSAEYQSFGEVINYLAEKHEKHPFPPHVTLSMLPVDFSLEIVRDVIEATKAEWFSRRVEFQRLFSTPVGIMIHGQRDSLGGSGNGEPLASLQQKFHDRLQEEVEKRRKTGAIPWDTPDVRNVVPYFPHMSLAYTERGQGESIVDIEGKGWYKREDAQNGVRMELKELNGYQIGAIFFAYCGGLRPEKWNIFERIEVEETPAT